jgi:hypothetical protein
MSNTPSKFHTATVRVTYSKPVLEKAWLKYSFDFTIDEVPCRTWYDPENDVSCFDCGDAGEQLHQLTQHVEQCIKECGAASEIDTFDLRKFACKHLQAMIKVEKELQRAPASERHCKVLNSEPVDVEKLSLEEQCVLEVLQEQIEKVDDGMLDGATCTITKEMVDAKMATNRNLRINRCASLLLWAAGFSAGPFLCRKCLAFCVPRVFSCPRARKGNCRFKRRALS